MAPAMKYVAAAAFFISSITATPFGVVKKSLAEWDEAALIEDLTNNQEGEYVHNSKIDWNAPAIDHRDVANLTAAGVHKRQGVDCNNRPNGISAIAICGPRFIDMGTRNDDKWGPALEAMPQFNHARLNSVERSCYPESGANAAGDGPNPGLKDSAGNGQAVGTDCADPNDGQSYSGPLMKSKPFPIYVDGVYCDADKSWRIAYNIYYPKDYNHRHDWERVIVVFKKDSSGEDWWNRSNLFLGQHSGYNKLPWSSATAHDDPYSGSPTRGNEGAHPRVFPGMYHHPIFNEAKTSCLGPGCAGTTEYRRNNWQYTPVLSDVQQGIVAIPEAWGDYDGKTTPAKALDGVCGL